MSAVETAQATAEHKPDLLIELSNAVKEQFEQDGTMCTPHGSAERIADALTERWAGTIIAARVFNGSPVLILKQGDEGIYDEEDRTRIPRPFPEMAGVIKSVSPANGGYVELDRDWSICLPNRGEEGPLHLENLRVKIDVLSEN